MLVVAEDPTLLGLSKDAWCGATSARRETLTGKARAGN